MRNDLMWALKITARNLRNESGAPNTLVSFWSGWISQKEAKEIEAILKEQEELEARRKQGTLTAHEELFERADILVKKRKGIKNKRGKPFDRYNAANEILDDDPEIKARYLKEIESW